AVEAVRPHVEALQDENPECAPTFFDATTATALLLFARSRVSRVLLEVGLGGRLDSTNAVQPAVTCITQIELEHTEKLGNTLAAIAGEKAGIVKPGVPCIMGPLEDEAGAVVVSRAQALGAPLFRWGSEVRIDRLESSDWSSHGIVADARQAFVYRERSGFEVSAGLGALGEHQVDNAAMAIAAIRLLGGWKEADLIEAVRLGLNQTSLPGRLELFGERPWLLVDSAHTERSAESLRRALEALPAHRRFVVVSISRGKDAERILSEMLAGTQVAWMTRADPIRSMEPSDLAAIARRLAPQCRIESVEDPRAAVGSARAMLSADDLLCCAGSIYLAGIARRVLGDAGADPRPRPGDASGR
ncbi:MAG: Mur ligase family protein, partial [Myxococcota bacterium]|nr:Mur ligase family protein [Myxococcota bacterium]